MGEQITYLAQELWHFDPTCAIDVNLVLLMPPGGAAWAADALITRGHTRSPIVERG